MKISARWILAVVGLAILPALVFADGFNFQSNREAMRYRLFKTLGGGDDNYDLIKQRMRDGQDLGLKYLRERIEKLFPAGKKRSEISKEVQDMLKASVDIPRRKIRDEGSVMLLIIVYQARSNDTGIVWITMGTVAFKFDSSDRLLSVSYGESARMGTAAEKEAPDVWYDHL
jgi:hypothetical protein